MKRIYPLLVLLYALTACRHRAPRMEPLPAPDLSPLRGKVVCVDPGHGGKWSGAIAPSNGLRESDVNLKVALQLERLLIENGATAIMTRRADEALHASSLSADLTRRAELANDTAADAFLSIHHNADIAKGARTNALEVYYKQGDETRSLDLAQCIMRGLATRLRRDAETKLLYPGNYRVLRSARTPSVLIESSYMTNAFNARELAKPATHLAEAEAIAAGLAEYFRMNPPRVQGTSAMERGGRLEAVIHFANEPDLDESTLACMLDGRSADGEFIPRGDALHWYARKVVTNGAHVIRIEGRSQAGASFAADIPASASRPAHTAIITQSPSAVSRSDTVLTRFSVRLLDAYGMPVADGAEVTCEPGGSLATSIDGTAQLYIRAGELPDTLTFRTGGNAWRRRVAIGAATNQTAVVLDASTDEPIAGATLFLRDAAPVMTDNNGWCSLPVDCAPVTVKCPGYEPLVTPFVQGHNVVHLTRAPSACLAGKVIVVDAAFGGRQAGRAGFAGTRASDLALDVAKRLEWHLRAGGATVHLTRTSDEEVSPLARVRVAMDTNADIFVSIGFGAPPGVARLVEEEGHQRGDLGAFAGHYPGSRNGKRLADAIGRHCGGIPPVPCYTYVVQQTPCPAVYVQPATVKSADAERQVIETSYRQSCAEGLYMAILEYFRART